MSRSVWSARTGTYAGAEEKLSDLIVQLRIRIANLKAKNPKADVKFLEEMVETLRCSYNRISELQAIAMEFDYMKMDLQVRNHLLRFNVQANQEYEVVRDLMNSGKLAETIVIVAQAIKNAQNQTL